MAKEVKSQKSSQRPAQSGLMVRIEYVGVIAVFCLLAGAIIGNKMVGNGGKIMVDTSQQQTAAMGGPAMDPSAQMPTQEVIDHLMQQIGNTRNLDSLVKMGNMAMDKRMTAVAVAAYEKALTIDPNDPNVLTDLGAVYNDQMGQSQKALDLFKKAAKLDPKHIQSRFNMAIAYRSLKNDQMARQSLNEVISLAPGSEQATDAKRILDDMGSDAGTR